MLAFIYNICYNYFTAYGKELFIMLRRHIFVAFRQHHLYIIALFWLISQTFQNGDYHGTSQ